MKNIESEPMLTPGQVARLFSVDPQTVGRWAKAGKLPFVRTPGGTRRFPEAAVRAFLNPSSAGEGQ